ncbi:polymorphic toxin-type HINT domain-containing protein [uncultured Acinetobacter sp.]|uniref:polymorphic toxin-type HINT domain-containing protein n=1 Tax=uncultured Acinetobacter sp. TaxID=165433 RepID=UPI00258B691D|nr:polymorphic toxin-type HINT domain-containing protein [uncultured Acinetobacter sp.]
MHKYKLLFVSLFLINQAIAAETEIAGSLKGDANVSSQGVLSYGIPVSIPNSLNGFVPKLTLNYNGQSSDGVMGIGWSISGLSTISRCQSGDIEPSRNMTIAEIVNYEASKFNEGKQAFELSNFCLDGKKLILTDSGSNNSQVEFHVENDEFSRVTLKLYQNGTIEKFIVTQKNGTIQEYAKTLKINEKKSSGQYVNKVVNGKELIYLWALTSSSDVNGNYWNVEYLDQNKSDGLYPKTIKYTGNQNGALPLNAIDFEYIDRNQSEKKISFYEGTTTIIDKKLSKLKISVNNRIKNEYKFQYEDVGVTNKDEISELRLKNINYCSLDDAGNSSCVVPTQFRWTSYDKSYISQPLLASGAKLTSGALQNQRQFIRLNSKKNSREQNLLTLMQDGNRNIVISDYQVADPVAMQLDGSKRKLTLNHSSFAKFVEWKAVVTDVNDDEIDDIIIVGKDSSNNISLIEFTTKFDANNLRQFSFYKELANIANIDYSIDTVSTVDGDLDGIKDLLLSSVNINSSKIGFFVIKLDINGNSVGVFKNIFNSDQLKNIYDNKRSTSAFFIGKFNANEGLLGKLIYNRRDNYVGSEYICTYNIINKNSYVSNTSNTCNSSLLFDSSTKGAPNISSGKFEAAVDFNNDGYSDIIAVIPYSNKDSNTNYFEIYPILSKGDGGFEFVAPLKTPDFPSSIARFGGEKVFLDLNGDGLTDFYEVRLASDDSLDFRAFLQEPDNKFRVYNYYSNEWNKANTPQKIRLYQEMGLPLTVSSKSTENYPYKFEVIYEPNLDFKRDGNPTVAFSIYASNILDSAYLYAFRSTVEPAIARIKPKNLLEMITDGDGKKTAIRYSNIVSIPDDNVKNVFPIRNFDKPMLAVSQLNQGWDDNENIFLSNEYSYSLPRVDVVNGRSLGFEKQEIVSTSSDKKINGQIQSNRLVNEIIFNQNYPFNGLPKKTTTTVNGMLLSKTSVADADFISDSAYPGTKVKFPRIKTTTTENYDLGKLISRTVNTNSYETVFGNLLESTAQTTSADGSVTFATKVNANYTAHDRSNWKPGLVTDRTVTATRTGEPAIVKKDAFEYDDKQRIKKTITEPDDLALKVQTDFQYDAYGNPTKVTVSGSGNAADTGIGSRSVTTAYEAGNGYPAGVFKTKQSNDLGQQSNFAYDAVTGQLLSSTDINGVVSTQSIDGLGRVISRQPAGGAKTDVSYELCKTFVSVGSNSRACEIGEKYKITSTSALSASIVSFNDVNGNKRRTITKAYDNVNDVIVRNEYNENGSLYRSSEPALSNVGYGSLQWTTFEYDALGRVVKAVAPGNRVTSYIRNGLETIITNAKGQNRIERSNIANETIEIVDHDGHSLKYKRDALGRLTQTTDALGRNIVLTLDKNGNKLQQVDPNLGTWNYRYNVLGQPIWQQDGKGQQTTFQYDSLGRLIKRTEPDLVSSWVWDTSANGKGQITQVSSTNGFVQSFAYDNFGRPYQSTTSKNIDPKAQGAGDSDFINKWNYDAAGRVLAYAYPTGFGYRNIYDTNGYLKEVRNLAGSQLYWTANTRDARGNVTQATLGNGLTTTRTYQPDTGLIESINTGNASIQQNSYAFDALGNLINRNQNLAGISNNEAFTYDNINRLKTVVNQQGQTTSVNYDAIGNITKKTSNLDYKPVKEQTYSWNSFNMPISIQQGSDSESFTYDANHQRVRRTSIEDGKTTTTVYINPRIDTGGTFEKTYLPNGTTEYTHYIYAGGDTIGSYVSNDKGVAPTGDLGNAYNTGVVPNSALAAIDKTGPYRYFHMDHLNSIEVITDAAGNPIERLSYDPWGKRRNVNGSESDIQIEGTKSSRGYTSHEMLDNIALVHMNGRVYDPQIGRFISADPNIDGVDDLQGYNRYAYVRNNPGTLWDPSGYGFFGKVLGFVGLGSAGNAIDKAFSDVGNGILSVMDKWNLCDLSKGNCGFQAGIVNGPNNQSIGGAQNGQQTIQPFIGINGNNNYRINFSYENNQFVFNSFDYNGILINAKYFTQVSNYINGFTPEYMKQEHDAAKKEFMDDVDRDKTYFEILGTVFGLTPIGTASKVEQLATIKVVGQKESWYAGFGRALRNVLNKFSGNCGCFDDDTPVLTKDGYKRIVDISVGDLVLARNEENGEIAYKPVSRVFVVPNRRIYLLTIEDVRGKQTIIEVSDDHPFWVVDKKWMHSIDLKAGDQLVDANNQVLKFVSLVETDRIETTYNLEVEGYHTYFAGDANVWVHNAKGPCTSWNEAGSWGESSLTNHFIKHGAEVGAIDEAQYLRKAQGFSQNLKGAEGGKLVDGPVEGTVRWYKGDKYIDIAPDNTIVSFGKRGYGN